MAIEKEINPYKDQDVDNLELPVNENGRFGNTNLGNLREVQIGAGNTVFRGDKSGIWLGSSKFATAPFSVDMDGNVIASSIVLSGYTTSSDVTTIIGDTVTTSYVNALSITAGSVAAEDITGTTITGKTVRTASSGQRVQMSGSTNDLRVYDSSGELRMKLDNDLMQFYNEAGGTSGSIFATDTGSYEYLYISNSTTDGAIVLEIDNTGYFAVTEDANVRMYYSTSSNTWVFEHDIYPETDGVADLGGSSFRWDTVYCYTLSEVSDINLKENIQPLSYGLNEILQIEPIIYTFKGNQENEELSASLKSDLKENFDRRMEKKMEDMSEEEKNAYIEKQNTRLEETDQRKIDRINKLKSKVHIGFSAQDVYKIIPEVTDNASPDSEETASINKTQLIPVLVKAIQELHEKIELLGKEINTLKKTPNNL